MKKKYYNRVEYYNAQYELHREDGPAIECSNGTNIYCINDQIHREDGPAVEYYDGNEEYWLNGKQYSFEEWNRQRKILFLK